MDPTIRLSSRVSELHHALAAGLRIPVEPRDAATVVLMRSGASTAAGHLQIHLLRRHTTMAFAGGMAVFPGGGVDQRDFEPRVNWAGPAADRWAKVLRSSESQARALVCAAARETFEECGVLLAGSPDGVVVSDVAGDDWEIDRRRLADHQCSLADLLRERNLLLRTDLMRAWSLWTTPEFELRRYRTWFFAAQLPDGQQSREVSTESIDVEWASLDDVIRRADAGNMLMLPPQYSTCLELFGFESPAQVLATPRDPPKVEPTVEFDEDGAYLGLPERLVELGRAVGAQMYGSGQGVSRS